MPSLIFPAANTQPHGGRFFRSDEGCRDQYFATIGPPPNL
jgi:hypothetical protein